MLHHRMLQVITVQAAGFGDSAPRAPANAAAGTSPGLLYAQLTASSSQLALTLWPPFLLQNEMPCPVIWLAKSVPTSDAEPDQAGLEIRSLPGTETPLHTCKSIAIRLEQPRTQHPGPPQVDGNAVLLANAPPCQPTLCYPWTFAPPPLNLCSALNYTPKLRRSQVLTSLSPLAGRSPGCQHIGDGSAAAARQGAEGPGLKQRAAAGTSAHRERRLVRGAADWPQEQRLRLGPQLRPCQQLAASRPAQGHRGRPQAERLECGACSGVCGTGTPLPAPAFDGEHPFMERLLTSSEQQLEYGLHELNCANETIVLRAPWIARAQQTQRPVQDSVQTCGSVLSQDVPCLRLKVLPAAVLQNCTDQVVKLECGGGVSASADPLTDEPMAWWPLRQRPRRGTLSTSTAGGIRLASDAFPLEPGDTLLALRSHAPAGMALDLI